MHAASTKLDGKTIMITGAYGGLGAAMAKNFADRGCRLALVGRNEAKLSALASTLKTESITLKADVSEERDCENAFQVAVEKFGKIDIVINNAAVWEAARMLDIDGKLIQEIYSSNVFSVLTFSRLAIEHFKRQSGGTLVNIASISGLRFRDRYFVYSSSKHAVVGFTGSIAHALENENIRVFCFCPESIKTGIYDRDFDKVKDAYAAFIDAGHAARHLLKALESQSTGWLLVLARSQRTLDEAINEEKYVLDAMLRGNACF